MPCQGCEERRLPAFHLAPLIKRTASLFEDFSTNQLFTPSP